MIPPQETGASTLSKEDSDRVQEFIVTYNGIDSELRRRMGLGREKSFGYVIGEFHRRKPGLLNVEYLQSAADLRNLLVHEPKRIYDYVAVPTATMLTRLKEIQDRLVNPVRLLPKFAKEVERVTPQHSLAHVLRRVAERDFSQFPVYSNGTFAGLLTESGITRWLAHHVTAKLSIVELEDVSTSEILSEEERRSNCVFASRNTDVESVYEMFSTNELLEAVLITQNGRSHEALLGIITRWDALR